VEKPCEHFRDVIDPCPWLTRWYRLDTKQEAQLSQRDRATLRVIEYFVKLLKITQGHSK